MAVLVYLVAVMYRPKWTKTFHLQGLGLTPISAPVPHWSFNPQTHIIGAPCSPPLANPGSAAVEYIRQLTGSLQFTGKTTTAVTERNVLNSTANDYDRPTQYMGDCKPVLPKPKNWAAWSLSKSKNQFQATCESAWQLIMFHRIVVN